MVQSQKPLANVCLFCGEGLSSPSMCTFCGFKFCEEHKSTDSHQCIKTRYIEFIRKGLGTHPDVSKGNFRVVCEMCGFSTTKGVPIEYAGEELIQHTQIVGCSKKVFLEEVKENNSSLAIDSVSSDGSSNEIGLPKPNPIISKTISNKETFVDQIVKLATLKEKGMISEQEFFYIKQELLKKMQKINFK